MLDIVLGLASPMSLGGGVAISEFLNIRLLLLNKYDNSNDTINTSK